MTDNKLDQLKTWLNTYLTIARAYLNLPATTNLKLYFLSNPPDVMTFHCSTANYKTLGMQNGEFLYNGPESVSNGLIPQLYCLRSSKLVPVSNYADFFNAVLISVNPEYNVGAAPQIKAQTVVTVDYVSRNGDTLNAALQMPSNWQPDNNNELVTKRYVDQLRFDLESRLALLEIQLNGHLDEKNSG